MTLEVCLRDKLGSLALNVNFRVERPGVTALFGPSGAGKTTIVNAIAGLFKPREGRVVVDGNVLLDTSIGCFVAARRRRMGYVFQDSRLFPHLTVDSNLRFGWRRSPDRPKEAQITEIVDLLGLASLLERKPGRLSGGEKSRVALARALLAAPRLLLLDEPLAALDAGRKAEILPWLERLRDFGRQPMIYVTHSTDEVSRLADDVIVLKDGRVAAQGSVFDIFSNPHVAAMMPAVGAVFPARVKDHQADGLTALTFSGGTLFVPRLERPSGTMLRVRLRADEVMLACVAPESISANNVLPVRIISVNDDGLHADIQVRCGETKLVARITRASLARLGLAAGQSVFAIIKSVTVDPQLGLSVDSED